MINGSKKDILIVGSYISKIGDTIDELDCEVLDGKGMTAIPGFVNLHTHSAMNLLRGVKEDLPLDEWLQSIWKIEANLNDEFVYWGAKLAALEMIKSGTTTFLDMYFRIPSIQKAFNEMGLRGFYSYVFINTFDKSIAEKQKEECIAQYNNSLKWGDASNFAIAVHADYTVDKDTIIWAKEFADANGLKYHFHSSETQGEVDRAYHKYGMSPIEYFNSLGVLDSNSIAAHCVWLSDSDIDILAEKNVNVVHNINSNLKISSGYKFKYEELRDKGVNICLGTDGAATNNNLDMLESMKNMALLQKAWREKPNSLPLNELLDIATVNGANALGLNAGVLKEGALADIALVNTKMSYFVPNVNFLASLVYAAGSQCIDTLICNGRVLMSGRIVEGEEEIITKASEMALKLINM